MAKAKAKSPAPKSPSEGRTGGRKLKVFRTPIGFHDAYVAAPSMKAALAAWGAEGNLFAQGIAEAVTDPKLMKAPLERPGEVIRVARGSAGEHLQAVGKEKGLTARSTAKRPPAARREKANKPDRAMLDAAEETLAAVEKQHRAELRALDREQRSLDRRKRETERRHEAEHDDAASVRDRAKRAYDRAMRGWRGEFR